MLQLPLILFVGIGVLIAIKIFTSPTTASSNKLLLRSLFCLVPLIVALVLWKYFPAFGYDFHEVFMAMGISALASLMAALCTPLALGFFIQGIKRRGEGR